MNGRLGRTPIIGAVKRRIAAATATAALAVSGPAVGATQRSGQHPPGGKPRVTRIGAAESDVARQALNVIRAEEMSSHRRRLAIALAAELPAASPNGIERALAVNAADPAATLAASTGRSEQEIDDAFEAMARAHALARRSASANVRLYAIDVRRTALI